MTFDEIFQQFAPMMAQSESSNNYASTGPTIEAGTHGGTAAVGKYQFMPKTLVGLGFDPSTFKSDPAAQEAAMYKFTKQNYDTAVKKGLIDENSDPSHVAGLLAAAHLGGVGGMMQAAKGQQGPADKWGTTPMKYYNKFASGFGAQAPQAVGMTATEPTTAKLEGMPLPSIHFQVSETPSFEAQFKAPVDSPIKGFDDSVDSGFNSYSNANPTVLGDFSRPESSWRETFQSSFVRENPIANFAVNKLMNYPQELGILFNKTRGTYAYEKDPEATKYADIAHQLASSDSIEEATFYKSTFDKMMEDKIVEYRGPGSAQLLGGVVAGIADPTTYVPFAAVGKVAKGLSLAEKIAAGATSGAISGIASESLLQSMDPTREQSESVGNVVGQTLFAGAFGPWMLKNYGKNAGVKFFNDETGAIMVEKDLKDGLANYVDSNVAPTKGVELPDFKFNDPNNPRTYLFNKERPVFKMAFEKAGKIKSSPLTVLGDAEAKSAREFVNKIGAVNLETLDNLKGFSTEMSAFERAQQIDLKGISDLSKLNSLDDAFRKATPDATSEDFGREVARAVQDPDFKYKEGDPVSEAAKVYQSSMKDMWEIGRKSGVFSEAVPYNKNYFTAVFDRTKIMKDPLGFQNAVESALLKDENFVGSAKDAARDFALNMLEGRPAETYAKFNGVQASFAKARSISSDALNELEPYRSYNLNNIMTQYHKSVGTEAAYKMTFGMDPIDVATHIKDEYTKILSGITDPEKYAAVLKEQNSVMKYVNALNESFFDQYNRISSEGLRKAASWARTGAVVLKGPMMGISQLPEFMATRKWARAIEMVSGKEISDANKLLYKEAIKLSRDDLDVLRVATDANSSLLSQVKFGSGTSEFFESIAEQTASKVSNFAYKYLNFVVPITKLQQRMSAVNATSWLLRAIAAESDGAISESSAKVLRTVGVTPEEGKLLLAEFHKNKVKLDSGYFPEIGKWSFKAQQLMSEKITKMVDWTIIKPQIVDRPLITQTEAGRTIFQFQSYAFGATNQVLLHNLQNGTGQDLFISIGRVALGTAAYTLKELYAVQYRGDKREIDLSPGKLVAAGIDNSGLMGSLSILNSGLESMFNVGLTPSLTGQVNQKFRGRSVTDVFQGSALGTVSDLLKTVAAFRDGKMTESESRRFAKQLPLINTVYLAWAADWIANAVQSQGEAANRLRADKYKSHVTKID